MLTAIALLLLSQNTVRIKDEGVPSGQPAGQLNCVGVGVSCTGPTVPGGVATITSAGAGAVSYQTIQEEGVALAQRLTVNFIGVAITCVDNGGTGVTDCTISVPTSVPPDVAKYLRGDGTWASIADVIPKPWAFEFVAMPKLAKPSLSPTPPLIPQFRCNSFIKTNCRTNCR